jgi:uncharacterized protein YdbL (DUF1318 family)
MKRIGLALATTVSLIALGCVITTKHKIDAHIVLDIRHIQEQADGVLDYIEGKTDELPATESTDESAGPTILERAYYAMAPIRVAYAAELKESSPKVKELADKMRARQPQIEALKKQGAIGEDNRGYATLRESDATADAQKKNEAQQLVGAENADRKALYREIANENADQNVTLTTVERVFAQRRLMRAAAGEVFQLPPAGDDFDKFKASPMGAKLGAECVPGAWVTMK